MISHQNIISNVLQINIYEAPARKRISRDYTEVVLGLLPLSHIYGLIVVAQSGVYRGDEVIILPKYGLESLLKTIQTYKIQMLYLVGPPTSSKITMLTKMKVPPILIQICKSQEICKKYDQSSVRALFTGAAPLGVETAEDLQKIYPTWKIRQGYGKSFPSRSQRTKH